MSAADLPFRQKLTPGTTAWRKSYRRRNVVEGVNAMLKGGRLQRRVHPLVQRA